MNIYFCTPIWLPWCFRPFHGMNSLGWTHPFLDFNALIELDLLVLNHPLGCTRLLRDFKFCHPSRWTCPYMDLVIFSSPLEMNSSTYELSKFLVHLLRWTRPRMDLIFFFSPLKLNPSTYGHNNFQLTSWDDPIHMDFIFFSSPLEMNPSTYGLYIFQLTSWDDSVHVWTLYFFLFTSWDEPVHVLT